MGWRNRERPAFTDRVRPDLVLCLAVVHHLAVGRGRPLAQVVEWLSDTGADVVVEVPHADDPMVRRLRRRSGLDLGYGLDTFDALVRECFDVVRTEALPGAPRTMYELSPRQPG